MCAGLRVYVQKDALCTQAYMFTNTTACMPMKLNNTYIEKQECCIH